MSNLVHHLVHSSHHSIPEDEAETIASSAEFIQEDWPQPQPKPAPATPPRRGAPSEKKEVARRSRSPPPRHPGSSSRSPPVQAAVPKSSGSRINARVAKEGAGPVFVEVLEHCVTLMKEFKKPPPPSQLELAQAGNMTSGDILMIPAEKIKHAIDALVRGITAATHAQRLALAAANSFSVEVEVLSDVKKTLEAVMVAGS
jgi:hypothetical protein